MPPIVFELLRPKGFIVVLNDEALLGATIDRKFFLLDYLLFIMPFASTARNFWPGYLFIKFT